MPATQKHPHVKRYTTISDKSRAEFKQKSLFYCTDPGLKSTPLRKSAVKALFKTKIPFKEWKNLLVALLAIYLV